MEVPIGAAVLVLEAEDVEQLVLHRPLIDAALSAEGHRLDTALSAHNGVAAATHTNEENKKLLFILSALIFYHLKILVKCIL